MLMFALPLISWVIQPTDRLCERIFQPFYLTAFDHALPNSMYEKEHEGSFGLPASIVKQPSEYDMLNFLQQVMIKTAYHRYTKDRTPANFSALTTVLEYLKTKKVDLSKVKDSEGYRLIEVALRDHAWDVITFLESKNTPPRLSFELATAAKQGNNKAVTFLLVYCTDKHQADLALKWAAGFGHLETVKLLIQFGATINPITG